MPPKDPTPGRSRGLHVVASDDDGAVVVADLEQLCRSGVAGLSPVAGAVVHLAPVGVASSVVAASAPEWERIGELADLLGEGPCIDAARMLRPVLVPDLAADRHRWPTYSVALAQVGVRGVFSFPLQVGAVNVGVLDLYAVTRTDLEPPDLALALAIAQVATSVLLTGSQASPRPDDPVHPPVAGRSAGVIAGLSTSLDLAEVHQAQGMLMVFLGVDPDEAMLELRGRATAQGSSVSDLARGIVSGAVDPRTWRQGTPGDA